MSLSLILFTNTKVDQRTLPFIVNIFLQLMMLLLGNIELRLINLRHVIRTQIFFPVKYVSYTIKYIRHLQYVWLTVNFIEN